MEHDDSEKLINILANQAANSPIGAIAYFRDLVKKAGSSDKWREVSDIWKGDSERDARELITWSINKTTLGSLLCALLPSLGVDENAKLVIELIIRYNLWQDQGILIKFLIDNPVFQTVFDEDSITLLTQYISKLTQDDINKNKIPDELIKKLILILRRLSNFDLVVESFLSTWDNDVQVFYENSQKEITIIKNNGIITLFRCFILFYLLLEKYPCQSNRFQRVIDFCTFLQNKNPDNDNSLRDWLQEIKESSGYQASKRSESASIKNELLEAYLMVIIRPSKAVKSKFRVNGFLRIGDEFEEWIYPDAKQKELGQKENQLTLKEAKEYVSELIYKSNDTVRLEKTRLNFNNFSITIDFFLPCEYLCECVDQWEIDLLGKIPLGKEFKLSVRSYERIAFDIGESGNVRESSFLLTRLEEKWQVVKNILEDNSRHDNIKQEFECLIQEKEFNLSRLEQNLTHRKIGLKLACSPPKSKGERKKFFSVFLRTGTPIAIWLRENQIQGINLETETDKWLKRKYLADLNLLLTDIRTERENAYFKKSILGDYLVIFCDNPAIKPTKPLSMSTSQPLSLT